MHPTVGLVDGPMGTGRYLPIRFRMSVSDRTPLPSPNASQAREIGKYKNRVKKPPPTMKLRGEWSLNSNTWLGLRALNGTLDDGRQKFTSSTRDFAACN